MQPKKSPLQFTKMHGLGNDFVIINALQNPFDSHQIPIVQLANRHTGIGFDQLLVIEPAQEADFFCRIFNADGSEAEQCGNGLRCVARYIHEENLHASKSMTIATKAGNFPITIKDYANIRVTMGAPLVENTLLDLTFSQPNERILVSIISMGNPHAILKVDSVDTIATDQLGPAISGHSLFPHGTNVGFMQIMNNEHIRLRTFERGAGETCACGSNACAAAVAGIVNGWLGNKVEVEFKFGSLFIEWDGHHSPLYMSGPAERVFSGKV